MYKKHHFHFVGINGIGMSGIAKILLHQGHTISGCDLSHDRANIQELLDASCHISHAHNSEICKNTTIDIFVYTSDVAYTSEELTRARSLGIKTIQRAALLAEILRTKTAIGVAGSHGKTTTSSMISSILLHAQMDPTIVVGGIMHNINNNAHHGTGDYAVAETDESDRSLLLLPISIAVLTNIDFEHANIYKNVEEVTDVFTTFINKIPFYGKAIICLDDRQIQTIASTLQTSVISYGTSSQSNIQAINIRLEEDISYFDVIDNRSKTLLGSIKIIMPSIYNVLNATGAITAALEIGVSFSVIAQALALFQGVDRRFTLKGKMSQTQATIFDDYGHHPTEIYHSLITARRKASKNLIVVFQPQRYSRTYHLWKEFVQTFATAKIDHLIITDIFSASEAPIDRINSEKLVQDIKRANPALSISYIPYTENLENIETYIRKIVTSKDLILLLGAGKVNKLAKKLL
jgi:UDP-N-acetylmuramate--alanine ligase